MQWVEGLTVFETRSAVINVNEEDVIITPALFERTKAQFMGLQPALFRLCLPSLFAAKSNDRIINCNVYNAGGH